MVFHKIKFSDGSVFVMDTDSVMYFFFEDGGWRKDKLIIVFKTGSEFVVPEWHILECYEALNEHFPADSEKIFLKKEENNNDEHEK